MCRYTTYPVALSNKPHYYAPLTSIARYYGEHQENSLIFWCEIDTHHMFHADIHLGEDLFYLYDDIHIRQVHLPPDDHLQLFFLKISIYL